MDIFALHFTPAQIWLGIASALLVGVSKTGIPGVGILVVTLLAQAFGGWESVGIMLPMLIFGDIFAAAWYKRHAQWDKLVRLLPWVLLGLVFGGFALHFFGQSKETKALLNPVIGGLVLAMLGLHLLVAHFGAKLAPHSVAGAATTGVAAGFATTVSNAAGPIMTIYLTALRMPKDQFMGTIAWYFFTINLTKVPILASQGLITGTSLRINLLLAPVILIGAFIGKWLLPRIPQQLFENAMLILAAVGAVKLLIP